MARAHQPVPLRRRARRAGGKVPWRRPFWHPALLALLLALLPPVAAAQELIANASTQQTALSRDQVRQLFTMRLQQWPDGRPARVFVLPDDDPLHARFAKAVLGLFPYQLRSLWDRQVFSGTGQAPTTVASEQAMVERVAKTPGAIGYVGAPPEHPQIRLLEVR